MNSQMIFIKNLILSAKKVGLDSKIDDLLNGKLVNFTENLAAWHPKYRKLNIMQKIRYFFSNKIQQNKLISLNDKVL